MTYLGTTELDALSTGQLKGLTSTQVGALGATINSLTAAQAASSAPLSWRPNAHPARRDGTTFIAALTSTQLGQLSGTQVNNLGTTNIAALATSPSGA